jgi:3-hydroxyisobutyrate dehydrogenase
MKVAILGTGLMGTALAEVMIGAGHETIVYNRTTSKTASLAALGATVAESPADAIKEAEATVIVLLDTQSVQQLLLSDETRLALKGKKLLNASTTKPDEIIEIAKAVSANGGSLGEVSIMVGPDDLRGRNGQFMLGCDASDKNFWAELLNSIGSRVDLAGDIGDASKAEVPILLTSMFGVVTAAYAAAAATKFNIPKEISEHYIPISAPQAEYFLPNLLSRNYDFCMASVDNFSIVSANAISAAKSAGLPTNILEGIEELFKSAAAKGFGEKDGTAINEILLENKS